MKALILAAGLGSRLRPLTNEAPKAMVKFNEIEIIKYQIDALLSQGIDDISVLLGYKSDKLRNFVEKNYKNKFNLITNEQFASSNSAYSSMCALNKFIDSDYIHINCDILFSESLLFSLINDKRENIICVRGDLELSNSMENVIGVDERIVNMALRTSSHAKYKAYGLAKINKQALQENISFYKSLNETIQKQENYYGLIRMSLGKIEYDFIESDKYNLSEINTLEDLKSCKFNNHSNKRI